MSDDNNGNRCRPDCSEVRIPYNGGSCDCSECVHYYDCKVASGCLPVADDTICVGGYHNTTEQAFGWIVPLLLVAVVAIAVCARCCSGGRRAQVRGSLLCMLYALAVPPIVALVGLGALAAAQPRDYLDYGPFWFRTAMLVAGVVAAAVWVLRVVAMLHATYLEPSHAKSAAAAAGGDGAAANLTPADPELVGLCYDSVLNSDCSQMTGVGLDATATAAGGAAGATSFGGCVSCICCSCGQCCGGCCCHGCACKCACLCVPCALLWWGTYLAALLATVFCWRTASPVPLSAPPPQPTTVTVFTIPAAANVAVAGGGGQPMVVAMHGGSGQPQQPMVYHPQPQHQPQMMQPQMQYVPQHQTGQYMAQPQFVAQPQYAPHHQPPPAHQPMYSASAAAAGGGGLHFQPHAAPPPYGGAPPPAYADGGNTTTGEGVVTGSAPPASPHVTR